MKEYGDSLTAEERKRGPKKKKPKPKVDLFPRPTGTLGSVLTSIEEKNEDLAKELISKLQEEFLSDNNLWNSIVDAQSSTLLHYAAKCDLRETLW